MGPGDACYGSIPAEFPLGAEPIFLGGTAWMIASFPIGISKTRDFIVGRPIYSRGRGISGL